VRLVSLRRIRTQSVDAMMRWMPQYFRPYEARGLAFTTQFLLTGEGGGAWAMRIADERCEVRPGTLERPDLTVRMPALLFLALHRGEASAAWGLVSGRIRLRGRRRLFLLFPRFFPSEGGARGCIGGRSGCGACAGSGRDDPTRALAPRSCGSGHERLEAGEDLAYDGCRCTSGEARPPGSPVERAELIGQDHAAHVEALRQCDLERISSDARRHRTHEGQAAGAIVGGGG